MIQRIQSLYLLLAAAAGAATWFYPLWRARLVNSAYEYFNGLSSYLYFILMMIIVALSLVCIFLFKKRRLQFRLTVLNILLSIGVIALQYVKIKAEAEKLQSLHLLDTATYLPAAFLPVLILVLLILAARGIYKDERLIRSLDRLR